jgi:hypothetical protein
MQSTITVRIWTRQVLESISNSSCAGVEPIGHNCIIGLISYSVLFHVIQARSVVSRLKRAGEL